MIISIKYIFCIFCRCLLYLYSEENRNSKEKFLRSGKFLSGIRFSFNEKYWDLNWRGEFDRRVTKIPKS